MERDPNLPDWLKDRWHIVAALLMNKLGVNHVVITAADVVRLNANTVLTVQERPNGVHLKLLNEDNA